MSQVYTLEPPTEGKVRTVMVSQPRGRAVCRRQMLLPVAPPPASGSANARSVVPLQVVLRTTLGDLDIELWPKEAPKAVRNFVQVQLRG